MSTAYSAMLSQSFLGGGYRVAPWIFLKAELSALVCRPLPKREPTERQRACQKEQNEHVVGARWVPWRTVGPPQPFSRIAVDVALPILTKLAGLARVASYVCTAVSNLPYLAQNLNLGRGGGGGAYNVTQ